MVIVLEGTGEASQPVVVASPQAGDSTQRLGRSLVRSSRDFVVSNKGVCPWGWNVVLGEGGDDDPGLHGGGSGL